jgi:drug/metabolite transporter (DMT)-like permease
MSTAALPAHDRILAGILFMCLASSLFPVMNGLVQVLSPRYPSEQLVWARVGSHLLFVLLLFGPRFGLVSLVRTTQPRWQVLRSVILLMSTFMFFNGVKHLELAKAASIGFTAPFMVALIAWPMLGERMTLSRLTAVIIAFLGVLIVIRPDSDVFQWASLLIVSSAACYALYQVVTRRVAGHDRPETSAVYSALVGTLVMSIMVPFVWAPLQSWADALLLFSLGILGGLGHYFVARAMTCAPANIIAPFGYWQMVGSVIVGFLISGLLPDASTWIGAGVIIAAGIYIAWCETRLRAVARVERA